MHVNGQVLPWSIQHLCSNQKKEPLWAGTMLRTWAVSLWERERCSFLPVGVVLTRRMVWTAESRLYFSNLPNCPLAKGFCAVHNLDNRTWRPYQWLLFSCTVGAEEGWALCQGWGALLASPSAQVGKMSLGYINEGEWGHCRLNCDPQKDMSKS